MAADADQRIAARRKAMDFLARREHSRQELERKLASRDFPLDVVREVLDKLRADGLQDDQRFVEAFVRSRVVRGKGPLKVMSELADRGVDAGLVQDVLASCDADWASLAAEAVSKRFGNHPVQDFKDRAKRLRFLAQRGFTRDQSQAAVLQASEAKLSALEEEV